MNMAHIFDSGTRRLKSAIIPIQSDHIKQSPTSQPASSPAAHFLFVWFNLLRYEVALVNKNVCCPHRFSWALFYDRIKLSKPQLGQSNFPGVHLCSSGPQHGVS